MDFVRACDFAIGDVERTAGEEAHSALRVGRFVFGGGVQRIGFVFVVADVSVAVGGDGYELKALGIYC